MNRRNLIKQMSRVLLGAGAVGSLSSCVTTTGAGGGGRPVATRANPFVNSLGMKFVPVPRTKVLFCTTETTVAQYQMAGLGYQVPAFNQEGNHPAVNVSWNDAKAWCAWLSRKEGRRYRLPSDAEWSAAVGSSTYPWGYNWPPPNNAGNYCGQEFKTQAAINFVTSLGWKAGQLAVIGGFRDNHVFTAPVGSYAANGYGLYDMGGNVWEWCEDKHPTVSGARVLRGGSWYDSGRGNVASSYRIGLMPVGRNLSGGFRCVLG